MSDKAPLLVACLCAAWCRTCTDYGPTFETLAAAFGAAAQFTWVDIEDDADRLGDADVIDFPTLLIARGERVLFFGPVLPHAAAARQLVERALRDALPAPAADVLAEVDGLPARLRTLGGTRMT
jgi:thioredoxin 1